LPASRSWPRSRGWLHAQETLSGWLVSAELNPLPTEFPGKAEQDTLDAWQLPRGSKNPSLVIVLPDESQYALELGPLPPP
jgi:hypothetical protein